MEAIYFFRNMMKQYRTNKKNLHLIFIDLKKTYEGALRDILWKVIEKKRVKIAYIRVIKDMYKGPLMIFPQQ